MQRFSYWIMGLLAVLYGLVVLLDYAAVQYRFTTYLDAFTPEQQAWFTNLPAWVEAIWGTQVVLALLGGLALMWLNRASVWLLGFSFIANLVMSVWMLAIAEPTMVTVTGWIGCAILSGSVVFTFVLWIYARAQKQADTGLL